MTSFFGGEGEREGVEGEDPLYHDLRLIRCVKELCVDGRGRGVTEPGVVEGVDTVPDESKLVAVLAGRAEESMLLRSSSSPDWMLRWTEILGLFCSSAIRSLDS